MVCQDISNSGAIEYNAAVNEQFKLASKPILEQLGLTHFIYIKLLEDDKRLYLCNDNSWIEFHVKNRLHEDKKHENAAILPISNQKKKYAFWDGYETDNVFNACHSFGMWNGFIVYDRNEIFSFATTKDKTQMRNRYLENIDLLEYFMVYFRNKAFDVINGFDENSLIHSKYKPPTKSEEASPANNFFDETKLTRFYLNEQKDRYITYREAECLFHFSLGRSTKEVAIEMKLSPRTVEKYMERIKEKFALNNKKDIIDRYLENKIDQYLIGRTPPVNTKQ